MYYDRFLINLAIIKTNWDDAGDSLLDNFMPIIGYAIQQLPDQEISEFELKQKVEEFSGFRIPSGALSVLIRRASRNRYGFVIRDKGLFLKNNENLSKLDFATRHQAAEKSINYIKEKFGKYCESHFGIEDNKIEFNTVFIDVLSDIAPSLIDSLLRDESPPSFSYPSDTLHYYVGAFIIHCNDFDNNVYDMILDICKGAVVAELLYYTDESMIQKKMNNVSVYFDTRLMLQIMGFADEHEVISALELLNILKDMSARLKVFGITVDEIGGILAVASRMARNGWRDPYQPGDAFDILCRRGSTSSDIQLIISTLDERIKKLGIRVEHPPDIKHSTNIDVNLLNSFLEEELPNQNQRARDHDIRAMISINQMRGGQPKKFFESCDAIFVTTNSGLSRACIKCFNQEIGISDAPICIPSHVFTMLMWLKTVNKKPDLPSEILLANALAASSPSADLWNKYMAETLRLRDSEGINDQDFYFLARTLEAKAALMDITTGNPDVVTEGTVKDVLRRAKDRYTEEVTKKYEESDARRDKFFRSLQIILRAGFIIIFTVLFLAFVVILLSKTDPTIVFQPKWEMGYYLSVGGLFVSALSLVLGFSFRRWIDATCENLSKYIENRVRAWLW